MANSNVRNDKNFRKFCKLHDRAYAIAGDILYVDDEDNYASCQWLYRNQSQEYFNDIRDRHDGLMKVGLKDNSGDPDSPINGRLSGLFFMASVEKGSRSGEPIRKSPFGPCRLLVPAEDLLSTSSNLYFADFYCMTNSGYHYVTLVVTDLGSTADDFCKTHLPSVDIMDNPWLFFHEDYGLCVTITDQLLVEVFYTENLDICECDVHVNIPTIGKGHSTPGGIPKNGSCRECNL